MIDREAFEVTIPNLISLFRIMLTVVLFVFLINRRSELAFILAVITALSDLLDGYLARALKVESDIGKILDPAADRLMVVLMAMGLSIGRYLPIWIGIAFLAREILAITGFILFRAMNFETGVLKFGKFAAGAVYVSLIGVILFPLFEYLLYIFLALYYGSLFLYLKKTDFFTTN